MESITRKKTPLKYLNIMRIVRYILFCSLALILVKAEDLGGAKKSAKGCDVTLLIKLFFANTT